MKHVNVSVKESVLKEKAIVNGSVPKRNVTELNESAKEKWNCVNSVRVVNEHHPSNHRARINKNKYVRLIEQNSESSFHIVKFLFLKSPQQYSRLTFFSCLPKEQSNQEMDLEDLIAPSKVSKNGGQSAATASASASAPSSNASREGESSSQGEKEEKDGESKANDAKSDQQEDSGERRGRRTRSKRPRSGEDFQELVLPERKRELRSSASRLAAAAAARYAAEEAAAKMANESQNN